MGHLAGKTILIVGAAQNICRALLPFLQQSGANCVLIDHDQAQLLDMAKEAPDRFELLPMDIRDAGTCGQFVEIWADEPIDVLLHFGTLNDKSQNLSAIKASHVLFDGLWSALETTKGLLISLSQEPSAFHGTEERASLRAFDELVKAQADELSHEVAIHALTVTGPDAELNALPLLQHLLSDKNGQATGVQLQSRRGVH